MTNYNLEEFKAWLEEKPERKENLPNWESHLRSWQETSIPRWQNFIKAIFDPIGFRKEWPEGTYVNDIYLPYREVFKKFAAERERERERESNRRKAIIW